MNTSDYKAIAKGFSDEILIDVIVNQNTLSEEERAIYLNEVQKRGLERELIQVTTTKGNRKKKVLQSIPQLTKESLFNTVLYNIENYSRTELKLFEIEIEKRGLSTEFSSVFQAKQTQDAHFKNTINNANSVEDLLENFNKHIGTSVVQSKQNALQFILPGLCLILLGAILTYFMNGHVVFVGAIVVGISLVIKGLFTRI
ncbi:MAG: hypothetical protein KTR13_10185 [Saprospiraceae bacterium]|nr:hypothetical protein [Saprospiraceae bacterium]